MKTKLLFRSFLTLAGFFCLIISAQAQQLKVRPFTVGENLTYEAKFSKAVLRGVDVADVSFVVEQSPDGENYLVKTKAKSKGTLAALFNLKFNQDIESTVDGERLQILKTVKRDEQEGRVRDSEAVFDYQTKKVVFTETDPNDVARPPRRAASSIEIGTHDLISAIYTLRRLPLAVGKTFELKISDSGLVYKIPARVTGRELQKSVSGKIWCYRVEPEIFGKNRLIEKEGTMILWITDDVLRLPVRAQLNLSVGRIEVKLKQAKINNIKK